MRGAWKELAEKRGLLTVARAAAELGCHPETVHRWIRQGKLPAVRYGRKVFVLAADLPQRGDSRSRGDERRDPQRAAAGVNALLSQTSPVGVRRATHPA